jgi:Holliday junction resolvase-like predicted endonuclease
MVLFVNVSDVILPTNVSVVDGNVSVPVLIMVDIVATKNGRLYFFEVKTVTREPRSGGGFRPEDNMHGSKIKRLQRVIQTYLLQSKRFSNTAWQLDLLCVYLNLTSRKARVERLENVIL